MRIIILHFLLLIVSLIFTPKTFAAWENVTDLPYSLASSQAFIENGSLYVIGGAGDQNQPYTLSTELKSSGLFSWIKSYAPPLIFHSLIGDEDKFVIGGYNFDEGTFSNKIYLVRTVQGSINYSELKSLPEKLALTDGFVLNNKIYIFGGSNDNGKKSFILSSQIKQDNTLSDWEIIGNTPTAVDGHRVILLGNEIYLIGGITNDGISRKVYKTKLDSDGKISNWSTEADLPLGITRFSLLKINNRILLFGGATGNGYTSKIFSWNFEEEDARFTEVQNLELPIENCCSPILNDSNNLYLIGGHDGQYYSNIWKLDLSNLFKADLLVPSLKQKDSSWGSLVYDNANLWSPNNKTIGTWGCAITSASMVMNYYGLTKIGPNTLLNPGTLNTWLQSQSDGYMQNGFVNWLAITRLTKSIANINPLFEFHALEYERNSTFTIDNVKEDLNKNIPDILEEPGHFVVAKGSSGNTIKINDPFHSRESLLDGYNNSYLSVRRLIPSNTNLSYIMITGDSNLVFDLKIGSTSIGSTFLQGPLVNQANLSQDAGKSIRILLLKQPASQPYNLILSSSKLTSYNSSIYFYDSNGASKIIKLSGLIKPGKNDEFNIRYNQDSNLLNTIEKKVNFSSLLNDIQLGKDLKQINPNVANALLTYAKLAEKSDSLKQQKAVRTLLNQMKFIIKQVDFLILQPTNLILIEDINSLLSSH